MHEELIKRLKYLATLEVKNGESYLNVTAEATAAIRELAQEAADAIENTSKAYQMMAEAYEAEVTKQSWISVMVRLPDVYEHVLVTNGGGFVCESFLAQNGKWQRGGVDMFFMTPAYWMPLPSPPKMKEPFVKDMIAPNKNESEDENNG